MPWQGAQWERNVFAPRAMSSGEVRGLRTGCCAASEAVQINATNVRMANLCGPAHYIPAGPSPRLDSSGLFRRCLAGRLAVNPLPRDGDRRRVQVIAFVLGDL